MTTSDTDVDMDMLPEEVHTEAGIEPEGVKLPDSDGTEGSSSKPFGPSSPPEVSASPPYRFKDRMSQSQLLQLDSSPPAPRPAHAMEAAARLATKSLLTGMVMNQLVNIVIAASRAKAGLSEKEASRMFRIWRNLVSSLVRSSSVPLLLLTSRAAS